MIFNRKIERKKYVFFRCQCHTKNSIVREKNRTGENKFQCSFCPWVWFVATEKKLWTQCWLAMCDVVVAVFIDVLKLFVDSLRFTCHLNQHKLFSSPPIHQENTQHSHMRWKNVSTSTSTHTYTLEPTFTQHGHAHMFVVRMYYHVKGYTHLPWLMLLMMGKKKLS